MSSVRIAQPQITFGGSQAPSSPQFAVMSDGVLVAWWFEYPKTPGSSEGRWNRYKSTDGGATWVAAPPTEVAGAYRIAWAVYGDTIIGFEPYRVGLTNVLYIHKWTYVGGVFTDQRITTSTTSSWNTGYDYSGAGVADTVKSVVHFVMAVSPDGGATLWYTLVAINPTNGAKVAEVSWQATGGGFGGGGTSWINLTIDTQASPKIYIAYIDTGTSIKYRSYTFNGSAYAAADAAETVDNANVTNPKIGFITLDGSGLVDITWHSQNTIRTRKRTGVGVYSGATSLTTDVFAASNQAQLSQYGNANKDLVLVYLSLANFTHIDYLKRVAGSWSAISTLIDAGLNVNDLAVIPNVVAGKAHLWYDTWLTNSVTFFYDYAGAASIPILSSVAPNDTRQLTATPNLSCGYAEDLPGDKVGKYLAVVKRQSDGVVMWNTGAVAAPAAPTLADGGAGAMGAGTYRYLYTFVTESNLNDGTPTGETAAGAEANITIAAAHRVNLTNVAVGPAGTIARKIYRTAAGGASGTAKLLATINDNVTTVYNDNTADPLAGAAQPTASSAAVFTAYAGADILPGGTFSLLYAGTALAKATSYLVWLQLVEAQEGRASALTGPAVFQWNDPPLGARPWTLADPTLAKIRVGVALKQPRATELFPAQCTVKRRKVGETAWTTLLDAATITKATEAGTTYGPIPSKGLALNLVNDGAPRSLDGFGGAGLPYLTLVDDADAPSGKAIIGSGSFYALSANLPDIRVKAAETYYLTVNGLTDGTQGFQCDVDWLDAAKAHLSFSARATRNNAAYGDASTGAIVAPANAVYARVRIFYDTINQPFYFRIGAFRFQHALAPVAWTDAGARGPVGDTGVVFDANADKAQLTWPADVDPESFSITVAWEPAGAVPLTNFPHLVDGRKDGNNSIRIYIDQTTGQVYWHVRKDGAAWVGAPAHAAGTTNAGDTVGASVTKDSSGMGLDVYVNGAVHTAATAVESRAKWHGIVPTTLYIGTEDGTTSHANGTIGIVRLQKPLTQAQRQAFALAPYQPPTEYDLHIYAVTASGVYEIPIHHDELAAPGVSYEYAIDTESVNPPDTMASGNAFPESYAAAADMVWLKCPAADLALKLRYKYDAKWPNERGRGVQLLAPVQGGPTLAVYNPKVDGRAFSLEAIWDNLAADGALATLDALQETDEDVYLIDFKGHSVKVAFADKIQRIDHPEGYLELKMQLVEAA